MSVNRSLDFNSYRLFSYDLMMVFAQFFLLAEDIHS